MSKYNVTIGNISNVSGCAIGDNTTVIVNDTITNKTLPIDIVHTIRWSDLYEYMSEHYSIWYDTDSVVLLTHFFQTGKIGEWVLFPVNKYEKFSKYENLHNDTRSYRIYKDLRDVLVKRLGYKDDDTIYIIMEGE